MAGDMMLSFPAGIVNVIANNPNPAKLIIRVRHPDENVDNVLPNKQLVSMYEFTFKKKAHTHTT